MPFVLSLPLKNRVELVPCLLNLLLFDLGVVHLRFFFCLFQPQTKFMLFIGQPGQLVVHVVDVAVQPVVFLVVLSILFADLLDVICSRLRLYLLEQVIVVAQFV